MCSVPATLPVQYAVNLNDTIWTLRRNYVEITGGDELLSPAAEASHSFLVRASLRLHF